MNRNNFFWIYDWKKKANIVLLQTINHEIGSRRQQNIIQDIEKLLSDKPSQIALN